jgi:hypothetical protein
VASERVTLLRHLDLLVAGLAAVVIGKRRHRACSLRVMRLSDDSVRHVGTVLIVVPPLYALALTHSEMRGTGAGLL